MDPITIEQVLAAIRKHLHLSKEAENELMDEIRSHLEDVIADARAQGEDEYTALMNAAEQFGVDEVGVELQELHSTRESTEAIVTSALPVLFALILRWLAFSPDGSSLDWPQLLIRPGFWIVAIAALIIPGLLFHRWRFALAGWGFFWLLTVIFIVFPSTNQW